MSGNSESVADSRGPAPVPDDAPTLDYTRLSQESDRSITGQKEDIREYGADHDPKLVRIPNEGTGSSVSISSKSSFQPQTEMIIELFTRSVERLAPLQTSHRSKHQTDFDSGPISVTMVVEVTSPSKSLDDQQTRFLRVCAGGLAVLVAWIHLLHPEYGYEQLLRYIEYGTVFDPRPPLFVISGLAIFAGIVLVFKGVAKHRVYRVGIVLMVVYLLGYVAWHTILDHGAFWPHIDPHHHDDVGVIESMVAHLQADIIAMVSKTTEFVLLILLIVLYGTDIE